MSESYRNTPTITLLRLLTRAYQHVQVTSTREIARYDLPQGEFDVLMTLGNTTGLRMCDLAQRTLTTPPNVTRLVKSLEAKGLVDRQRNPASEREVIARLTPAGEALFEEAYPEQYRFWRQHFDGLLSDAEQRQLRELLGRLCETTGETAASAA